MDNKLICRKCQGNHLTIKCGKEKPSIIEETTHIEPRNPEIGHHADKPHYDKSSRPHYDKSTRPHYDKQNKKNYKVKMSNLPTDVSEEELRNLLYDWGHLSRIKVLNYDESSTAYLEFNEEEEVDYLIQALNKTAFDNRIINLDKLLD